MITGKLMTSPVWLKTAADPAEAAAQLYSRLLVAREIGPVYGHGVLPDWVKAAQSPLPAIPATKPPTPSAPVADINAPGHSKPTADRYRDAFGGLLATPKIGPPRDEQELLRARTQADRVRTELAPIMTLSGLQIGALGGAGIGLTAGLFGKKKRPLRGALLGGLAGGGLGTLTGMSAGALASAGADAWAQKQGQVPPPTTAGEAAAAALKDTPSAAEIVSGTTKGVGDAAGVVHAPTKTVLDSIEGTVRPPLRKLVDRSGLGAHIPPSNADPSDPLGALGSSIRPALVGTGIGAGVGLLGGLTGKKKRPIRGLLMGGLAGGLAGGAGGYLYDRFAASPPADKPTPEKIQEASDRIRSQAPGAINELHAGALSPETWSGPEMNKLLPQLGKDILVGGGVGAAAGAGVGAAYRGAANVVNKGSRTEYEIPTKFSPKGKPTIDTAATGKQLLKTPKVTAVESAMAGARRGGMIGAATTPALTLYQHVKDHGVTELSSANPALAAEGIQKLTAYSPSIPPPPSNPADPASVAKARQIMAERQQLLLEAQQRQAELTALAQTGQGLSAAERQKNDDLRTRLGNAGLIQIQPVGKRR